MLENALADPWDRRHEHQQRRRGRAVLVVDPVADRRRTIVEALQAAGWPVREAATPLEAIARVVHDAEVVAVAIARATRSQTCADELAGFLCDEHPHMRVALMPDEDGALGGSLKDLLGQL